MKIELTEKERAVLEAIAKAGTCWDAGALCPECPLDNLGLCHVEVKVAKFLLERA